MYKYLIIVGFALIAGLIFLACEGPNQPEYGPDNPDPNATGLAAPTLTSLTPAEGYLKDEVTINGSGFNSEPSYNLVAFGSKVAEILSASTTALTVVAPSLADQTVQVKVAAKGSELWSNLLNFTFYPTMEVIADDISWPNGVDVDNDGNVYIGSANDGIIYKIDPTGTRTEFATIPVNGSIHFGPNDYLYVCGKGSGKIWWLTADGTAIVDSIEISNPVDMDWDADLNMYIAASGGLHRLDTAGNLENVASVGSRKSCRVFGNYIYVTSIWDSEIHRFEIGVWADDVVLTPDDPCALEIDIEGTLYYSSAWERSVYTLKTDGSEEVLYEDELMTPMRYFCFKDKTLYVVFPGWNDIGEIRSVYIGVEQAPRYGRS